jgi:hypothetical protein
VGKPCRFGKWERLSSAGAVFRLGDMDEPRGHESQAERTRLPPVSYQPANQALSNDTERRLDRAFDILFEAMLRRSPSRTKCISGI